MTHETSMGRFEALFNGAAKPVIAMAQVPALPHTPLWSTSLVTIRSAVVAGVPYYAIRQPG